MVTHIIGRDGARTRRKAHAIAAPVQSSSISTPTPADRILPLRIPVAGLCYCLVLDSSQGAEAITANDQEELERLSVAVIQEKDPAEFTKLVEALNQFQQGREQARKASAGALCAKPSDA